MQSVFGPAARRTIADMQTVASSPRRWPKNVLDEAAAQALGYGDCMACEFGETVNGCARPMLRGSRWDETRVFEGVTRQGAMTGDVRPGSRIAAGTHDSWDAVRARWKVVA